MQKALDLAVGGKSYDYIAQECGYNSPQAAWNAVSRMLKAQFQPAVKELRGMQIQRIDNMLDAIWASVRAGNLLAMDRALRLEERRAKLLGLDAPIKTANVDGTDETPVSVSIPASAIAPNFSETYRDILAHNHVEYVERGGRGSTKSSFVSLTIIELMVNNPEWHVLVLRQVANTLRDSVYSQLMWAINYLGLENKFSATMSPMEITYLPTKQKIYFRGGDDPLKIKSIKPRLGYINVLWFEELDQFRGPEAVRNILQSAIRGGDHAFIFKSFNPPRSRNNWVHKDLEIPKPNRLIHTSDYRTVPKEWLGQAFLDEAEFLASVNPGAYEHEYLGIPNSAGGLVFENLLLREIPQDEIDQYDRVLEGLDFGYYPDPLDWGKMYYDAARMTLYIYDEFRANKMSNRELYDYLVTHKGYQPEQIVVCDSAEPKSIADLRDYGMTARPAEKGPESVTYSHKWLQSLRMIVIDPVRCPNTAKEFQNYEYDTDADGNYISEYPDKDNHAIDRTRYATNHIWRRRGQ